MQQAMRQLQDALGAQYVLSESADKITYSYDATYLSGLPEVVVFPGSAADVQAVFAVARRHRLPVFVRGSGTGLSGGSVPDGGIALVMTRMNKVLEIDGTDLLARVQPGVITGELQEAVRAEGLFYPPDPGSARISTIGGNVAQNAGGPRAFHYGTTGRFVLGLEVVLPDGSIVHTGGRTTKNVTGYDLTSLFVGSEGTIGVATEVILRLLPLPPTGRGTVVASFSDLDALGSAIGALAGHAARPTSIEFLDRHCLAVLEAYRPPEIPRGSEGALLCEVLEWPSSLQQRLDELTTVCEQHGAIAVAGIVESTAQDRIWNMRQALSPVLAGIKPAKISEDATVPLGSIPGFLADLDEIRQRWNVELMVFGHAGDGNFHPDLICDDRDEEEMGRVHKAIDDIFAAALHHRGTLSGEHGVGLLKLPYMHDALSAATLEAMRAVKRTFDPHNLLNPGKMLPAVDMTANVQQGDPGE